MKNLLFATLMLFYLSVSAQTATIYANDGATSYLTTMGYVNGNLVVDGEFNVTATGDIDIDGNVTASNANSKLQMHSVSDHFSNLMIRGTATGTATYLRYVNVWQSTPGETTGNNDLVSAPFTNTTQTFGTFRAIPTNVSNLPSGTIGGTPHWLFGPFNNDILRTSTTTPYVVWSAANDSEIIIPGVGYRTGSVGGSPLSFTGDMLVSTVTVPITQGDVYDWNLIGNPYATYIDCEAFLTENQQELDQEAIAIYGYDGSALDGWTVINFNNATGVTMPPGQAFMVKVEGAAQDITFTPTMRTMSNTDDFIAGRSLDNKYLKLKMKGNNRQYFTEFYFNHNSTRGLDPGYDAHLHTGPLPETFMFSHLVEDNISKPYAMQSLPANDFQEDVLIPLGVVATSGDQLIFSIEASSLPENATVYFFDAELNTVTDLTSNNYTVQLPNNVNGTGRFYINFANNTLNIKDSQPLDNINVYVNQNINHLIIASNLNEPVDISVFDMHGRLVLKTDLHLSTNSLNSVDLSHLSSGFYLTKVQLKADAQVYKTTKIILK